MSRTTLIDCDRCGRRIEAPSAVVTLSALGSLRDLTADLCGDCAGKLREWLRPDDRGEPVGPSRLNRGDDGPFLPGSDRR